MSRPADAGMQKTETSDAGARRPIVVGAGISGLAAARALRRQGANPLLLEAAAHPGGTFRSPILDGPTGTYRPEMGPNTVQDAPALRELCADAGCGDDLVEASNLARRRYLVRGGRLIALPGGPPGLLTTPLLSPRGKLRLATEPWRRPGDDPAERLADWARRRLGPETAPLVDAMSLGVYAGDPAELVASLAFPRLAAMERDHGSLFAGLRASRRVSEGSGPRKLLGFRGGFGTLATRLAEDLDLRLDSPVRSVRRQGEEFVLALDGQTLRTRRLILALPARATYELTRSLDGSSDESPDDSDGPLSALAELPHAPVAVVALGYRREAVEHPLDGFGLLAPHAEGLPLLGCLFTSTLFPDRAPEGGVLLTVMLGGRRHAERVEASEEELVETARTGLADLLGLRGEPECARVQRWRPGIPQPTPAWAGAGRQAAALEAAHPGLSLLGNWRGVGVPDCARAGWEIRATPDDYS